MLALALAALLQLPSPGQDARWAALVAAEDARARTPEQLATLLEGAGSPDTLLRRIAVRALGRLERADLIHAIAPHLAAGPASVRLEAANAMAQAAYRGGADTAWRHLRGRLGVERVTQVRGALLASAGRLALDVDAVMELEPLLVRGTGSGSAAERAGAVRGLYDLWRRQNRGRAAPEGAVGAVRRLVLGDADPATRRVALLALGVTGRLDSTTVVTAARDADPQVRLFAAQLARTQRALPGRAVVATLATEDSVSWVRLEGIRAVASAGIREQLGCGPLMRALEDRSPAVQLVGIEALGQGCPPAGPPVELLDRIAQEPISDSSWHRPARALLALAGADTARAAIRVGRFADARVWWARAAAARTAGLLRDATRLEALLQDPEDNVREAALTALATVDRAAAARAARAQLGRDDPQLLLTAVAALRGGVVDATLAAEVLATFLRLSARQAETSRDIRLALLEVVEAGGSAAEATALRPALQDFDPVVAARAAEVVGALGEGPAVADPRPLAVAALPAPAALRGMTRAVIIMADGGQLEVGLDPGLAPASVARFVAMARSGWFDGLTFHRVVPNFVVQGGSPGANEYAGAPAFSRDEVGGSHRRGTVGISTRGRDTGDGQIFINLVDNLRLDHEYTVIGEIVAGWEVLDRLLEGARIVRVEVPPA